MYDGDLAVRIMPAPENHERYRRILQNAPHAPLSEVIPELLILAQETERSEVAKWAGLELGGYFRGNSALTKEVVVPEYRIVVGQYSDRYGRPLVITDSRLAFVNEYRLRFSVPELERMENRSGLLTIDDPTFTDMIRDKLNVEVHQFCFSPSCVSGVLSGIRARFIEMLQDVRPQSSLGSDPILRIDSPERPGKSWLSGLAGRKSRSLDKFHPIVIETASRLYSDGHYRQAVLDTYIALVQRVKEVSGRADLDNTALMQTVFSPKNPIVVLSEDPDEQMGYMWMFTGAVMGVRNPKAHRLDKLSDAQRAKEWLAFSSALFRLLDAAKITSH
jgi:uncharacterized protein (TIGR02391 family)